jgi:hypothetical protein
VIFPHRSSPPDNVERFIGRDDILAQISSFLKPNNSLEPRHCCLWDLGESGNRKPALAYANRYSADYDAVFWIRAATETSLNQGFRDIALDLGLVDHSRRNTPDENQELVHRWLKKYTIIHANPCAKYLLTCI